MNSNVSNVTNFARNANSSKANGADRVNPDNSNPGLENMLLGAALKNSKTLDLAASLPLDVFSQEPHRLAWSLLKNAHAKNQLIKLPSIHTALGEHAKKLGGLPGLTLIERNAPDHRTQATQIAELIDELTTLYRRRKLIEDLANLSDGIATGKTSEAEAITALSRIRNAPNETNQRTPIDASRAFMESMLKPVSYDATGLVHLDAALGGGLLPKRVITIEAFPKVGKTTLAKTISYNLGMNAIPHLFISYDISEDELIIRDAARYLKVPISELVGPNSGEYAERYKEFHDEILTKWPVHQFYRPRSTIDDIVSETERAVAKFNIHGVFIDHLHKIAKKDPRENDESHYKNCMAACNDLAKSNNIWVFVLAQKIAGGYARYNPIDAEADVAFTLHRPNEGNRAWLEMTCTRYTTKSDAGTPNIPALNFVTTESMYFCNPGEQASLFQNPTG